MELPVNWTASAHRFCLGTRSLLCDAPTRCKLRCPMGWTCSASTAMMHSLVSASIGECYKWTGHWHKTPTHLTNQHENILKWGIVTYGENKLKGNIPFNLHHKVCSQAIDSNSCTRPISNPGPDCLQSQCHIVTNDKLQNTQPYLHSDQLSPPVLRLAFSASFITFLLNMPSIKIISTLFSWFPSSYFVNLKSP